MVSLFFSCCLPHLLLWLPSDWKTSTHVGTVQGWREQVSKSCLSVGAALFMQMRFSFRMSCAEAGYQNIQLKKKKKIRYVFLQHLTSPTVAEKQLNKINQFQFTSWICKQALDHVGEKHESFSNIGQVPSLPLLFYWNDKEGKLLSGCFAVSLTRKLRKIVIGK